MSSAYDAIERVAILRLNDAHDNDLDPPLFRSHVEEMDRGRAIDSWRATWAGGLGIELQEMESANTD